MTNTTFSQAQVKQILSFFSGVARTRASASLTHLETAIDRGYWLPEDKRRSIEASLNKVSTEVKNKARAMEQLVSLVFDYGHPLRNDAWRAHHNLFFGSFIGAQNVKYSAILAGVEVCYWDLRAHVEYVRDYAAAFAPVAAAIKALDAQIPPPVFTYLDVSRTITKTLEGLGFSEVSQPKVQLAPYHFEERQAPTWDKSTRDYLRNAEGKILTHTVRIMITDWPAETKHGAGRFGYGNFTHCESCGHAIQNVFNWVPLLITTADGQNYSLWVGRDCARSLFGIKVTGEVRLATGGAQ